MENLRAQVEADLHESIEGEWGLPVQLTGPDGTVQTHSKTNPTELLRGQVLYYSRREDPATGEVVVVPQPVLVLRVASLVRVPNDGEEWHILMPTSPAAGAPMKSFILNPDRAIEHGTDIGFIRLYPQLTDNESEATPSS